MSPSLLYFWIFPPRVILTQVKASPLRYILFYSANFFNRRFYIKGFFKNFLDYLCKHDRWLHCLISLFSTHLQLRYLYFLKIVPVVSTQVGEPLAWCLESNVFINGGSVDIQYSKVFDYNFINPFWLSDYFLILPLHLKIYGALFFLPPPPPEISGYFYFLVNSFPWPFLEISVDGFFLWLVVCFFFYCRKGSLFLIVLLFAVKFTKYKYTFQYFEFLQLHSSILKHFSPQKFSLILCALKFPLPYTHESINTMKTVNIPVILRSFIVFLFNLCLSYSAHLPKQPLIYSTTNLFYVTIGHFIFLKTFL